MLINKDLTVVILNKNTVNFKSCKLTIFDFLFLCMCTKFTTLKLYQSQRFKCFENFLPK